jgi:hypothetical protein
MSLSGTKSGLGVNMRLSPLVRQDPGVVGERTGKGELCDKAADNVTVIGALGATPVAPFAGVTEATLRAGGVSVELVVGAFVVEDEPFVA